MSLRSLGREALCNLRTGRLATVIVVLSAFIAVSSTAYLEARAAQSAREDLEEFQSAGGFIFAIGPIPTGPAGSAVPEPLLRRDCERLNGVPGVVGAGSAGRPYEVGFVNSPGERFNVIDVTPGMHAVLRTLGLDPEATAGDLVVSGSRLERLGVAPGRTAGIDGHGLTRFYEAPLESVSAGFIGVAFGVVAPTGAAEGCYVAMEPRALDLAPGLRAVFGRSDTGVRRVLAGAELAPDALEAHATRDSRHAWWLTAALVALVARFALWTRRSEIALYRSFGLRPGDVRLLLAIELAAGLLAGAVLGAAAARIAVAGFHPDSVLHGWLGAALAGVGLVGAVVAAAVTTGTGDPLASLKDR